MKIDKTVAASALLHAAVIGWGLISFSSKAFDSMPEDSVPVDIISADQFAKAMAGMKTGKKENPKPLVEKVAEPKPPVDDAVGKVTEKPPVVTEAAPQPPPKPVEKPVEKKPDPPKPVVEDKPKEPKETPKAEKKDPPPEDKIAEALKKDESKKPPPKPEAKAAPPQPPKPKVERTFDATKMAALIDKRDPSRAAITGDAINSQAALGTSRGRAADNSATWGTMFQQQAERCWKKPYGGIEAKRIMAEFELKLKKDGTLESMPVPLPGESSQFFRVFQESALRAIIECQPYKLPAAFYEEWRFFIPVFRDVT